MVVNAPMLTVKRTARARRTTVVDVASFETTGSTTSTCTTGPRTAMVNKWLTNERCLQADSFERLKEMNKYTRYSQTDRQRWHERVRDNETLTAKRT